ncbi:hypothetical protein [Sphingobacterium corticis]|uniref:hypothetical protein n=1 Tax=Sphingobacterium corticis TaxID=1812823 RepID=UPI0036D3C455
MSDPNSTKIFIGDLDDNINNTSAKFKTKASSNSVFIGNNSNLYPGAVYLKESVDNFTFNNEYPFEKTPFDYYFGFTRKFIAQDIFHTYGRGLRQYFIAEENALNSQKF